MLAEAACNAAHDKQHSPMRDAWRMTRNAHRLTTNACRLVHDSQRALSEARRRRPTQDVTRTPTSSQTRTRTWHHPALPQKPRGTQRNLLERFANRTSTRESDDHTAKPHRYSTMRNATRRAARYATRRTTARDSRLASWQAQPPVYKIDDKL